jgi:hypothetical protein
VDSVESTTDTIRSKDHQHQGHLQDALEMSSEDFITHLQIWLYFIRAALASRNITEYNQTILLFELLFHNQVLSFYEHSVSFVPQSTLRPDRLLEHFHRWLVKVESRDPLVALGEDHVFDQAQHFISSELINTGSSASSLDHTLGYQRALLVIQRWAREHTSRKRLFTTSMGCVGIGWQALKETDQIVRVPGLRSPLLIRRVERAGFDEIYQLIGPCHVPEIPGLEPWKGNIKHMRRFELV